MDKERFLIFKEIYILYINEILTLRRANAIFAL